MQHSRLSLNKVFVHFVYVLCLFFSAFVGIGNAQDLSTVEYTVNTPSGPQKTKSNSGWIEKQWDAMGTRVSIDIYLDNNTLANQLLSKVVIEVDRLEQLMSTYIATSEVSLINRDGYQQPVNVSKELIHVLLKAQYYSEITSGAFDITYASVGYFYDLRNRIAPAQQEINQTLASINYRFVDINEKLQTVRLKRKGVRIDLGGIAKGYVVDIVAEMLIESGVTSGIVTAGGDTRIIGDRRGRPWMIGIKDPRSEKAVAVTLPLDNTAFSTSGDYERYFMEGGERFHHILSPKTGKSVHSVQSVSILAPSSIEADALSTAVFVLGVEKGVGLIDSMAGVDTVIIDKNRKMHFSKGLQPGNQ